MGISTTAMALCVNCGFVGTTLYINGQGPYCGRCANQASGVPMFTSPSARDDDAMREKVKRLMVIVRAIAETDDHERLSEITVDIPSRDGYPRQWIRAAALAEVEGK
jgi:hypothetical protein